MVDLRAYVFLDSLQAQFASYQATISRGYLPKVGQASLFVEIAPGMAINHVLDVALKSTDVTAGMLIVERHFGMLEIHSESQADVRQAGQAILDELGLEDGLPGLAHVGLALRVDLEHAEMAFDDQHAGRDVRRLQRHVKNVVNRHAGRDLDEQARLPHLRQVTPRDGRLVGRELRLQ